MKAAAIDRFGPPSVLKLSELPVPKLAPNEVLIALIASGVGVWDADVRKGWWPRGRPAFPLVLALTGRAPPPRRARACVDFQLASACGPTSSPIRKAGSMPNTWL